ncbi:MAG: DUF177 domain-containing protein [Muribaculaceae bacterium]|nr:DUF177 domain-containing protein [Muribaculaceae bacterium]
MNESYNKKAFELNLGSLGEGVTERDLHVGKGLFEYMGADEVLDADVDVAVDIEKRPAGYKISFGFDGWLEVACDRCLEPLRIPVDTDYNITVKYGEEASDEVDGVIVLPYDQLEYDIAPVIYDTLMLALPIRRVHEDGECNPEMTKLIGD